MNRKSFGYIGVAVIGVGFIMMASSNTLHSETASVLQGYIRHGFHYCSNRKNSIRV